jgi:hypothetical protein
MTLLIVILLAVSAILFAIDRSIRTRPGLRKHQLLFGRKSYIYVIALIVIALLVVNWIYLVHAW